MSMQHIGIFGPGQSGKTTLARAMVQGFADKGFSSLVLDLNGERWPRASRVLSDEERFWELVWIAERCIIVVEEATETIARNKDLIKLFTRIRHRGHKLLIVGHNGTNLLPIMREQIHFLHLFRQPLASAQVWASTMAEDRLLAATTLKKYQFIRCIQFGASDGSNLVTKGTVKL